MAARIPDRTVREIVEQTDMVAVVGEVVELRKAGASVRGLCPFHHEKTPSFHVQVQRKLYRCHGCQEGGDVIAFVRKTRGLSFIEAVEYLAERAGIRIEREILSPHEQARMAADRSARGRFLALNRAAQEWFRAQFLRPAGEPARAYAANRGLDEATMDRFGVGAVGTGWTDLCQHLGKLGFTEDDIVSVGLCVRQESGRIYDKFRNRLMFPIFTAMGDLVGFGGRDLGSADGHEVAKYMNSPETTLDGEAEDSRFHHFYKKGHVVFGLWQSHEVIRRGGRAFLVEGNLDVMTLVQAGIGGAVCPMGTALTEQQCKEIRRFTDKVTLVFDGDAAGRKAAMKSVPTCIAAGLDGTYVTLPDGEDPDSFVRTHGGKALRDLADKSPDLLGGYIDGLVKACDGSLAGKAAVLQQAGPLLASIADPITRDMARDQLAARLIEGGDRATLDRYLGRLPQPPRRAEPGPPPDAAHGEPQIPPAELDLAHVLVGYPAFVSEAERLGAIDALRHDGLRLALRDLCAEIRDRAARGEFLDGPALDAWVVGLADGRARRALLDALMLDRPHVPAAGAESCVRELIALVHVGHLTARQALIVARLGDRELAREERLALFTEMGPLQADIQAWSQEADRQRRQPGTAPERPSAPTR